MLGSAVFRTGVAPGGALAGPWVKNELWNKARSVPSLDLRFAENKSLVDATTGQNLVTFTRASSGTYVDSQGVIQRATTNLLLRSEEFNDASWTKQSSVSVSANTVIAPNGTLTADTVTADSGLGIFQTITSVIGVNYSNSIYVKAGTATSIMFRDDTGAGRHIVFNPSTGVITSTSGTFVSFGSQAVGDGWYRYWLVYAADATGVRGQVRPNSAGSAQTFAVWGAQLEQSSTVGEYIPTTSTINSAPRFDHNPTTGESLGLLVEESRTNLFLQSNQFDTTWTNSNSSETAAAGIAPDGTNTAWELRDTSDASAAAHSLTQSVPFTSGNAYTFTVWMKAGTLNEGGIAIPSAAFGAVLINRINLSTGAVISTSVNSTTVVTPFGNGWYRIALTATATATASGSVQIRPMNGGTTYIGTGTGTVLIWGAQLEAGAFPTSYIPTTTATVTRSADVASITGSNFSSWYNTTQGTVFTSQKTAAIDSQQNAYWFSASPTVGRGIAATIDTRNVAQRLAVYNRDDVSVSSLNVSPLVDGAQQKIAHSWSGGTQSASLNGLLNTGSYNAIYPSINQLSIGFAEISAGSPQYLSGSIERLTFWPSRLPNETLQGITQ